MVVRNLTLRNGPGVPTVGSMEAFPGRHVHKLAAGAARRTGHRRGAVTPNAREALIVRHLPLARALAARYRGRHEPQDDLVQVASLALVKAADRWDPGRGVAFSTYAVPTILGELRRYFRDMTWDVRPPRDVQDLWLSIGRLRDELQAELPSEPTVGDLAARLDRSPSDVSEALLAGHARHLPSLDAAVDAEADAAVTVADLVGRDDDGYARAEARATVQRLMSILDDRAREVLRLRFEDDLSQAEIAARLGVSQVSVSRILRSSLELLSLCARRGRPIRPLRAAA